MALGIRKGSILGIGLIVLIVIVLGYFAGLSYSRYAFMRALDRQLSHLSQKTGKSWQIADSSQGLFNSSMTVVGGLPSSAETNQARILNIPMVVHHGVFGSSVDGKLFIAGNPPHSVFPLSSLLDSSHALHFHVSLNSLYRHVDGQLKLANLDVVSHEGMAVKTDGVVVPFSIRRSNIDVSVDWKKIELQENGKHYLFGAGHYSGHFFPRMLEDGTPPFYKDHWDIQQVRLRGIAPMSLVFGNLHFDGDASLANHYATYHLQGGIDRADLLKRTLGGVHLNAVLDRIDSRSLANIVFKLSTVMKDDESSSHTDSGSHMNQALTDNIHTLLQGSPRLRINQFDVESSMLKEPLHIQGMVNIDGRNLPVIVSDQNESATLKSLIKQRLHGDLDVLDAPPLLSLLAGVDPDDNAINMSIRQGDLIINGHDWFTLLK